MNFLQVIILSIIEGVTEFLPVSSTGHLILASKLLNIPSTGFAKSFNIFIQLGAIMAVAMLYWKTLYTHRKLWLLLAAAFLPTAIVGFTLYPFIKRYLLDNTMITTINLFLGGIVLIGFERMHKEKSEGLTWQRALIIGLFQSISIFPGVSRAAATIIGGLSVGLSRKDAVEFSFLLALPTMTAATGLDLLQSAGTFQSDQFVFLAVGFIGAWITARFTVKTFLAFIKTNSFVSFGVYRLVVAGAFALQLLFRLQ